MRVVVRVDGDLDGLPSSRVPGSLAAVPVSVVVQDVYVDATQVTGYGFTTAVEIQFLGE